jgi:tetratricopeptide (TPR) repeat protein
MAEGSEKSENAQAPNSTLRPTDRAQIRESKATVISLVVACISLLGTIALGVYSAHLTNQQNSNAQQQELVTLVTDIEQGQQAATEPNGSSAALIVLGEAEEANNIIADLHSDVSSVEKYIVGKALEDGDDYQPALTLLTNAAQEKSDPRTTADSWRAAAGILYSLDMNSQAENDINQAKESYSEKDVTERSKENNVAFTDFFDIPFQVSISIGRCSFAEKNEWDNAVQLMQKYHDLLSGSNAIANATSASNALLNTCKVPPATLKAKNILGMISP